MHVCLCLKESNLPRVTTECVYSLTSMTQNNIQLLHEKLGVTGVYSLYSLTSLTQNNIQLLHEKLGVTEFSF